MSLSKAELTDEILKFQASLEVADTEVRKLPGAQAEVNSVILRLMRHQTLLTLAVLKLVVEE